MVLLTTTPYIRNALSTLPSSLLTSLPSISAPPQVGSPVDHRTLIALAGLSKSQKTTTARPQYTLSSLLQGTSVYVPPPPPRPEPSPEYLALKQRLLEQQEQRQYALLLNKSSSFPSDAEREADDAARDDITPSLVFNILLSILLCAGATFYITRFWSNDGIRVLLSLLVGIVVGVAEATVYSGYLRKVERSRRLERKKREVKIVLGEYTDEDEQLVGKPSQTLGEKEDQEEIWGRGANGGVRRRVREEWEKEQDNR